MSYQIFFFGIGLQSEKHFARGLNKIEKHLFDWLKPTIEKFQDFTFKHLDGHPERRYYTHALPNSGVVTEDTVEFYYFPFDGHVNRLSHYYRHLFQTASYIIEQDFLTITEKYSYMKTLRAQLSNFEQLLLYYNSLAWFDKQWREIFTTYRLIKNIPLALADFDEHPLQHYAVEIEELEKKGIKMFEWLEV